ncbi:arabinofuranosyltransferase [Tsukamurella sp. 8F]|uniref:arabinofuranosyltransferase n=1 Tax=unclassified Tsukamurella TaxID=2633480 RepID=UPI0023B9C09C|nr:MULTISPECIES: arabinofuranosyltransferase [unclassified Tsukamurella]MDF0531795.1 arabinofuranosyltransferase [Tsukamurella sp. 8J]MDF0589037.1 arabinofuranosyltransferase [Tsukamurella sp. 8F]
MTNTRLDLPEPRAANPLPKFSADVACALVAAVAVTAAITGLAAVWHPPVYTQSNMLHSATTLALTLTLLVLVGATLLERRANTRGGRHRHLLRAIAFVAICALPIEMYGLPLLRSRLWLGGLSGDQSFRTQFLTRLTDSPALQDMTYHHLPPFYPAGWFWLGGRFGALFDMAGWEAMKPWSLFTLAIAAGLTYTLWRHVLPHRAVALSTMTVLVALSVDSQEPYAATLIMVFAPMMVLAWQALREGGWLPCTLTGLFVGILAATYTLYCAVAAVAVLVFAGFAWRIHAAGRRNILHRLGLIAAVAGPIALAVWLPYLISAAHMPTADSGGATDFLPVASAMVWLPQTETSALGLTCLVGTVWMTWRIRTDRVAQALAAGLLTMYGWALASQVFTLFSATLLGFRVHAAMYGLYACAGVMAAYDTFDALRAQTARMRIPQAARWGGLDAAPPRRTPGPFGSRIMRTRLARIAAVLGLIVTVAIAQDGVAKLGPQLRAAYQDVDGDMVRADNGPHRDQQDLATVQTTIGALTGKPADQTVVLSTDTSLFSYYPYWGFLASFGPYSNPLGLYPQRVQEIRRWTTARSPEQLEELLGRSEFGRPDAFVLLRSAPDGATVDGEARDVPGAYYLRIAENTFPNDPNLFVRYLAFDPAAFAGMRVRTVGAYAVVGSGPGR